MKTPLTPQQALANFRLLTELSPRNTYAQYRAAVHEIAAIVHDLGILGDNQHPDPVKEALQQAITFIENTTPDDGEGPMESITTSIDDGPEFTFDLAAARRALGGSLPATT